MSCLMIEREQNIFFFGLCPRSDGYLQPTGQKNARLRLEHKADHAQYLTWKARLLPQLFQGKPVFLKRIHPITKKEYSYVRQQSNSSPFLGKLRKLFYPQGKKQIPKNLAKLLKSPIAFAIWYFDDGYYYSRDKCAYIYLGRVSREEAVIASEAIKNCFGLSNRILDKKVKGFALYFSHSELQKLKLLVEKYAPEVMTYKINFT